MNRLANWTEVARAPTLLVLRMQRWALVAAAVLAVFGLVALALTGSWRSGQRVMDGARGRVDSIAGSLAHEIVGTLHAADVLIRLTAKELGPNPLDPVKRSSVSAVLAELTRGQPLVRSLRVLDPDQTEALFDFTSGREISFQGEEDLRSQAATIPEGTVAVGRPVRESATRGWLVPLARRISARDGIPGNLIIAHIDLAPIHNKFTGVGIGENGVLTLFRSDGLVLLRRGLDDPVIGRDLSSAELFREQLPRRPAGTYAAISASDGVERLISYRALDGYPIVLAAGLAKAEIQAEWWSETKRDVAVAVGIAGTLGCVGLALASLNRKRLTTERNLKETEAEYRLLADNATDMIVRADLDTTRRYISPSCLDLLGYSSDELVGTKPSEFSHPEDLDVLRATLKDLCDGTIEVAVTTHRARRKDGSWIWLEGRSRLLRDALGAPIGYVASLRNVSERRQLEEQLRELASTDPLTRMKNRRAFESRLSEEWSRAARHGHPVAVVSIDVDHFKQYNDHFGHGAGDKCLIRVAGILAVDRRAEDLVARVGGEEFAILLPETDIHGAGSVAELVRAAVASAREKHPKSSHKVVTVSCGAAALVPQPGQTVEDLLRAADRALYRAKQAGRNRVATSPPPRRKPLGLVPAA